MEVSMSNNQVTMDRNILQIAFDFIFGRFKFFRKLSGGLWIKGSKIFPWVNMDNHFNEHEIALIKERLPRYIEDYRIENL